MPSPPRPPPHQARCSPDWSATAPVNMTPRTGIMKTRHTVLIPPPAQSPLPPCPLTPFLLHASGAQQLVPVLALAEVDSYRRSSRSERAFVLLESLLAIDPRFLNLHWCLGSLNSMRGRLEPAVLHFARVAEGEWGRIWPSHNLGKGFWHADLALVAEFLLRNIDLYTKASRSPIIRDIFASEAAADGAAWAHALEESVKSGDWFTARIIALNGMIDSPWPPGGWPKGHVRSCLDALVLACEKLGFAGRVDGLLELWLTSPDVE